MNLLRLRAQTASALRPLGLYHPLRDCLRARRFRVRMRRELALWHAAGKPPPPPAVVKHAIIRRHACRYGARTLVETGTFYGDTLFALRRDFTVLHSIELAPHLHQVARRELGHLRHIHLHLGDSAQVLPRLLPGLHEPTLFWLDGHFCSGPSARGDRDTPVATEVDRLLARAHARNVVLIDDARLFNGHDDYPTIEQLRAKVTRSRPAAEFSVENDIVCIAPV